MENQIYRLKMVENAEIEFYVCGTNEVDPYRSIRELGVVFLSGEMQWDGEMNINELDSLIKYLTECKAYIIEYNKTSVPEIPKI